MNAQGGVCWLLFQCFWTSWWGIFFLLFPSRPALFSLFGSFSSRSLLLHSLFILSLKLPDHPPLYWPEPVWPVSVEHGLSFSTCTPAYLVWGGCHGPTALLLTPPWGRPSYHSSPSTGMWHWWGTTLSDTPPSHCSATRVPSQCHLHGAEQQSRPLSIHTITQL